MPSSFSYTSSGGFELISNYNDLVVHYYDCENNLNDGFGNFNLNLRYDTKFFNETGFGYYVRNPSLGTNSTGINGFYSGTNFSLTFRFRTPNLSEFWMCNLGLISVAYNPILDNRLLYFDYYNSIYNVVSDEVIQPDTWYFVSLVKSGNTFYTSVNAGTQNTYTYSGVVNYSTFTLLYIGFNQDLADIRFYSVALPQSQLEIIYNNGVPVPIQGAGKAPYWRSPAHYYNLMLNQPNGTNEYKIFDEAGNLDGWLFTQYKNISGVNQEPLVTSNSLRLGTNYIDQAGNFEYSGSFFIPNPYLGNLYTSQNSVILPGSFSVCFWLKKEGPSAASTLQDIYNQGHYAGLFGPILSIDGNPFQYNLPKPDAVVEPAPRHFAVYYSNQTLVVTGEQQGTYIGSCFFDSTSGCEPNNIIFQNSIIGSSNLVQDWNHIAFTYDYSIGIAYCYINGILVGSLEYTRQFNDYGRLLIGSPQYAYGCYDGCKNFAPAEIGLIASLRFYNVALTVYDVEKIYGCGINADINFPLPVLFNTGNPETTTYRFESSCNTRDSNGQIVPAQTLGLPCELTTFVNVGSDSLTNACKSIIDQGYDFELTNIQRWSKFGTFQNSTYQDGYYIDVQNFCNDANCFQLCCKYRTVVNVTLISIAITDKDIIVGKGRMLMAGTAIVAFNKVGQISRGIFRIFGAAAASQIGGLQGISYTGSGRIRGLGNATYESTDKGTLNVSFSARVVALNFTTNFVVQPASPITGTPTTTGTKICGCNSLPYKILINHNLNKNSQFIQFIRRNNFAFPGSAVVLWNETLKRYNGIQRFQGVSINSNIIESWNIVYEMYCDGIENQFSGEYEWFLTVQFYKKSANLQNVDSKIVVLLNNTLTCPSSSGVNFFFRADANLNTKDVTVNRNTFLTNSVIVNDRIGIFSSGDWITNPILSFGVGVTL